MNPILSKPFTEPRGEIYAANTSDFKQGILKLSMTDFPDECRIEMTRRNENETLAPVPVFSFQIAQRKKQLGNIDAESPNRNTNFNP